MRKLSDEEKSLESKYIQNPIKFSTAIEKEEYEMAARIRDRIKEIEKSN